MDIFREFALPYLARIAEQVKQAVPDVPIIVFAKGANHSLTQLSHLRYDVVAIDWCVDPAEARAAVGDRVALMGNLNPAVLYASETVIRQQV